MMHTHEQANGAAVPASEQWEYCMQTIKYDDMPMFMNHAVNEMGRQGWEMLTAAPISRPTSMIGYFDGGVTTRFELIFKRRLRVGGTP